MSSLFAPLNGGGGLEGGYFLGGRTRVQQPTRGVGQGFAPSARKATEPGRPVPGGTPARFPSSSQKPGNREGNQRVPYARFLFTWLTDELKPRHMQAGDVCFVHRMSQAMGHGTNRTIKVTGIPQLNHMLNAAVAGVTTLDFVGDPSLVNRVRLARVKYWEDALVTALGEEEATEVARQHYGDRSPWNTAHAAAVADVLAAKAKLLAVKGTALLEAPADFSQEAEAPALTNVDPETDWPAVSLLADWTLDGVVINVDDDVDIDDTNNPRVSRDDGLLMNVCIQGPTPMRNTNWRTESFRAPHEYDIQHVDEVIPVMDRVFVGLFALTERNEADGKLARLRFYYKLFSGRQLYVAHLKRTQPDRVQLLVAAPFAQGPSEAEFKRLMGAWRVGSVMDNRLTQDSELQMVVNVCTEWWTVRRLRREYDEDNDTSIGSEQELRLSSGLAPPGGAPPGGAPVEAEPAVVATLRALQGAGLAQRIAALQNILEAAIASAVTADAMAERVTEWEDEDPDEVSDELKPFAAALAANAGWLQNFGAAGEAFNDELADLARDLKNVATKQIVEANGLLNVYEESQKLLGLIGYLGELADVVAKLAPELKELLGVE